MPHNLDLIFTLTGGLLAALMFGLVTQRLKLSPIVGYLLAGVAVGPFTPGFVAKAEIAEQLAELGVILLMFGVGLHFHVKELLAVRRLALPGAIVQIAVATGLGVLVTRGTGWGTTAGIVFGLAIAVASTVVLLRVLADHDALHTPSGHVAVGWLLVEDIFTVLVLVVLPIVVQDHGPRGAADIALSLSIASLKVVALIGFTLVFGRRVIPKLLDFVAKTRSRELFTLAVLALALGVAVGSAKLFGASMALGAFLAGMVVGQSEFSSRAASEALPMRDAFSVLFFVAMGMLFDPLSLPENVGLIAATLAVILIGKPLAALVVVLVLRGPPRTAVSAALALAQIGEFSFILAALGRQLEILPQQATQVMVAASIISITLNPLLFKLVDPVSLWLLARLPGAKDPDAGPLGAADPEHRAVVVGYGPVGKLVVELLRENGLEAMVIELNHETVNRLRDAGIPAIYGDASQSEILERAGARVSGSLVFTAPSEPHAVIRAAKELNPELRILTRATYLKQAGELAQAGAEVVVTAEAEVALGMTLRVLEQLGATADQRDRARDRIRLGLADEAAPTS
ncbi:MAG TPA: cation:proton antiporter [Polyangiaceae bacterium]|nr:cation:proton antiporter [Polyangiaceae bacterium]